MSRRIRKSDQFLAAVAPYDEVVFLTHDNPDPDGIACGWALGELVRQSLGRSFRLMARGAVMRAENRQLLNRLRPPLELVQDLPIGPRSLVVLIDCRPEGLNHPPLHDLALAVIDHHEEEKPLTGPLAFVDVRPEVAAAASIGASYLHEQRLTLPPLLATALAYAIRTEGGGGSVTFSSLDRRMLSLVSARARADLLTEIEEAPLPRAYFNDLTHALQNTVIVEGIAYCMMPQLTAPETVGELADMLIRCEGLDAVLCCGRHDKALMLSTRTRKDSARDASRLVRRLVDGIGHSGGHRHRAGGRIPLDQQGHDEGWLQAIIRNRWLEACEVTDPMERPMIDSLPSDPKSSWDLPPLPAVQLNRHASANCLHRTPRII